MNAEIAEMAAKVLLVYSVASLLLVVMSFVVSALALEGLDKLDVWLRCKNETRQSVGVKEEPLEPELEPHLCKLP